MRMNSKIIALLITLTLLEPGAEAIHEIVRDFGESAPDIEILIYQSIWSLANDMAMLKLKQGIKFTRKLSKVLHVMMYIYMCPAAGAAHDATDGTSSSRACARTHCWP